MLLHNFHWTLPPHITVFTYTPQLTKNTPWSLVVDAEYTKWRGESVEGRFTNSKSSFKTWLLEFSAVNCEHRVGLRQSMKYLEAKKSVKLSRGVYNKKSDFHYLVYICVKVCQVYQ